MNDELSVMNYSVMNKVLFVIQGTPYGRVQTLHATSLLPPYTPTGKIKPSRAIIALGNLACTS